MKLHSLQFGFKIEDGCEKAFVIFETVVEYFNKHGSTEYVSTLDLTKAYNKYESMCVDTKVI